MNPFVVIVATILLIVASAFFVIVEFSLLGARRNRLELEAEESRSARAALRGLNELTVMLAGAQLGITMCTFALGAVTKPAIDYALGSVLESWGIPAGIAGTASFLFSLLFVTFLHLVIGEMAPKSWSIAHPERSAKLVALPARAFIFVVKPLLHFVNVVANGLVKASGVEPVDRAAVGGRDIDTIRALVEQSAQAGALSPEYEAQIARVAELQSTTVGDFADLPDPQSVVSAHATARDVREASRVSGAKRILVSSAAASTASTSWPTGIIHVRDVLLADLESPADTQVREVLIFDANTPVNDAFQQMREQSEHLAVVRDGEQYAGVLRLESILTKLLPTVREH